MTATPSCTTTPHAPGSPLPHAWLGRGTHDVSTLDLGAYDRFTLITGADGAAWEDAAGGGRASSASRSPCTGGPRPGAQRRARPLDARREVADRGCVLVRPDRFVGWRSHDLPDDPTSALTEALTGMLGQ